MNNNFNLEICSDLDYEGMVVDISYKNDLVATLYSENGIEIKLYPIQEEYLKFSYEEFLDILEKAKKLLIELNKKK